MRVAITNSIENTKLKFIDIKDTILVKEICVKDYGKALTLSLVLNIDNRGRNFKRNSNKSNSKDKSKFKSKSKRRKNVEC